MVTIQLLAILAILAAGLVAGDMARAQTPRRPTEAMEILHNLIRLQKEENRPPMKLPDVFGEPASATHNMWSALAKDTAKVNISAACANSTARLLQGIQLKEPFAWQVLDATGKPESGYLRGNLKWLGSFTECQSVQAPLYPPTNESQSDEIAFVGMPCTAVIRNASLDPAVAPGVNILLCAPSTCSELDVNIIWWTFITTTTKYIGYAGCYPEDEPAYDTPAIAMICFMSVLGAIILAGTLYDILVVNGGWRQMLGDVKDDDVIISHGDVNPETQASNNYVPMNDAVQQGTPHRPPQGILSRILVSFSVASNASKILSTKKSQGSLDAIHGIRFISMTWVILGHTYAFGIGETTNILDLIQDTIKTWHFQAIVNATVSVDSFFLLSGLLVAYLLLKELERCGGPRHLNWAKFYFHRFWRLTPPYMIILGFHTALFKYWATGPMWSKDGLEPFCAKNWWKNLLYINNVVDNNEQCMGWAWYLANDMQFFIISPIFIVALYMNWIAGMVITLLGLFATMLTTALITTHYGYGPGSIGDMLTNPNMATWNHNVYFTPWCRIGPYLVGILYGYLIFKTKRQIRLHKGLVALGWVMATACALAVLYGLYDDANGHPPSTPVAALYAALNRTVWGAAVGWVVFACVTGYGGWVNSFLSWPTLMPLSRLTYMAYLVHPIVMFYFYASLKRTLFAETLTWVYLFLGHVAISYAVAFVASLSVEAPMMGLEKVLLR